MILLSFGGSSEAPDYLTIALYHARFASMLPPLNVEISMWMKCLPRPARERKTFGRVLGRRQDFVILWRSNCSNNPVVDRFDEIGLVSFQPIPPTSTRTSGIETSFSKTVPV
jgi:hypothetical protein